jgi:hypothetical protein
MATLTSSPALLYNKVRFLQPSGLVVKYCKPVLRGVPSHTMFHLWLLHLAVHADWLLWSSKSCMARVFVGVPISLWSVECIFQPPANHEQVKDEDDPYDYKFLLVILYLVVYRLNLNCLLFWTPHMRVPLDVFSKKKEVEEDCAEHRLGRDILTGGIMPRLTCASAGVARPFFHRKFRGDLRWRAPDRTVVAGLFYLSIIYCSCLRSACSTRVTVQ